MGTSKVEDPEPAQSPPIGGKPRGDRRQSRPHLVPLGQKARGRGERSAGPRSQYLSKNRPESRSGQRSNISGGESEKYVEETKGKPTADAGNTEPRQFKGGDLMNILRQQLPDMSNQLARGQSDCDRWTVTQNKINSGLGDQLWARLKQSDCDEKFETVHVTGPWPTCLHAIVADVITVCRKTSSRKPKQENNRKSKQENNSQAVIIDKRQNERLSRYIEERRDIIVHILRNYRTSHYDPQPIVGDNQHTDWSHLTPTVSGLDGCQEPDDAEPDQNQEPDDESNQGDVGNDEENYPMLSDDEEAEIPAKRDLTDGQRKTKMVETPLEMALREYTLDPNVVNITAIVRLFAEELPEATATQVNSWFMDSTEETSNKGKIKWLPPLIASIVPAPCETDENAFRALIRLAPYLDERVFKYQDEQRNVFLHHICKINSPDSHTLLSIIKVATRKYPKAIAMKNSDNKAPYRLRFDARSDPTLKQTGSGTQLDSTASTPSEPADDIAYLKRLSLSCGPLRFAVKLLCNCELEPETKLPCMDENTALPSICLDLTSLSNPPYDNKAIQKSVLREFINLLNLDSILKYVRIPYFRVYDDEPPQPPDATSYTSGSVHNDTSPSTWLKPSQRAQEPPNHCAVVLKLLQEQSRDPVHTILELIVDDKFEKDGLRYRPHSNMAIKRCLEPFARNVDKLDWKKVDVCCDAIRAAAPNIRTLHLYTSGNPVVLKGWVNDLPSFTKLKDIYLEISDSHAIEDPECIETSIKSFRADIEALKRFQLIIVDSLERAIQRLREEKPQVKSDNPTESKPHGDPKEGDVVILPSTEWLDKMQKFASFVAECPHNPIKTPQKIKVAVIDDGFDLFGNLQNYRQTEIHEAAFPSNPLSPFQDRGYFSTTGHGTLMTNLIHTMCPKAALYIAKYETVENTKIPDKHSVTEAIKWATANKVDIISMSWSIRVELGKTDEGSEEQRKKLDSAIEAAAKANILLFASSTDRGLNVSDSERVYPAFAARPETFIIGASDNHGAIDKHVIKSQAHYLFPGGDGRQEYQGSSFSTALAAGLTALILYCTEIRGYSNAEAYKLLRRHEHMKNVLDAMCHKDVPYVLADRFYNKDMIEGWWKPKSKKKFSEFVDVLLQPITRVLAR